MFGWFKKKRVIQNLPKTYHSEGAIYRISRERGSAFYKLCYYLKYEIPKWYEEPISPEIRKFYEDMSWRYLHLERDFFDLEDWLKDCIKDNTFDSVYYTSQGEYQTKPE